MSVPVAEARQLHVEQDELSSLALGAMAAAGHAAEKGYVDAYVRLDMRDGKLDPGANIQVDATGTDSELMHSVSLHADGSSNTVSVRSEQLAPASLVQHSWLEQTPDGLQRVTAWRTRSSEEPLRDHRIEPASQQTIPAMFEEAANIASPLPQSPQWRLDGHNLSLEFVSMRSEDLTPTLAQLLQVSSTVISGRPEGVKADAHIAVDFNSGGRLYRRDPQQIAFELRSPDLRRAAAFRFLVQKEFFNGVSFVQCMMMTSERGDDGLTVAHNWLQQDSNQTWHTESVLRPDSKTPLVRQEQVSGDRVLELARKAGAFVVKQ